MRFLPYATQTIVTIGPFLSSTDFKTPQTGLAATSNNLLLFPAGGSTVSDISTRTFTHIQSGTYSLTLQAGDTSVVGPLVIEGVFSTAVPLSSEFMVLGANAYAALLGTGLLSVNATQIAGNTSAASNMAQAGATIQPVIIGAGSSTTVLSTNLTQSNSAVYVGRTIIFATGACAGQAATISAYNGSTKQVTVPALTTAPSAGDTAVIV